MLTPKHYRRYLETSDEAEATVEAGGFRQPNPSGDPPGAEAVAATGSMTTASTPEERMTSILESVRELEEAAKVSQSKTASAMTTGVKDAFRPADVRVHTRSEGIQRLESVRDRLREMLRANEEAGLVSDLLPEEERMLDRMADKGLALLADVESTLRRWRG